MNGLRVLGLLIWTVSISNITHNRPKFQRWLKYSNLMLLKFILAYLMWFSKIPHWKRTSAVFFKSTLLILGLAVKYDWKKIEIHFIQPCTAYCDSMINYLNKHDEGVTDFKIQPQHSWIKLNILKICNICW